MRRLRLLFSVIILTIGGCAPQVVTRITDSSVKPLPANAEVLVLETNQALPDSCEYLGAIALGYNGSNKNCSYDTIMMKAKNGVLKAGGNILRIKELSEPGEGNNCYAMEATIYFRKNIHILKERLNHIHDSLTKSKFPPNPNFALLYVYRPKRYTANLKPILNLNLNTGYLIGYNIHIRDSVVCRAKDNSKYVINLYKPGKTTIWAETESKDSVNINVEFGKEYFLKCTAKSGVVVGEPDIRIIPNELGSIDYESVEGKK